MSDSVATDKLIAVFADTLNVPADKLSDASSPDNTPEWDSMAAVSLVSAIEDTFGVQLSTREIMKMNAIGTAREVLRSKGVQDL